MAAVHVQLTRAKAYLEVEEAEALPTGGNHWCWLGAMAEMIE